MVVPQEVALRDMTLQDQLAAERQVVLNICEAYSKGDDQQKAWEVQTGKAKSSFYRSKKELQREGLLNA